MVYLTRRYHFSASHRLHSESLTDAENQQVYGKCNRPHGHGHNYLLHVTIGGPVDSATGMVLDLAVFDRLVKEEVLDPMDHAYLNLDLEPFRRMVATTENVCIEIFNRLAKRFTDAKGVRLSRILLEETPSNYFEYDGLGGPAAAAR
ncbi:MAG: 6-carboxytetrahydropterin synthase [Terriglobia bacterium]